LFNKKFVYPFLIITILYTPYLAAFYGPQPTCAPLPIPAPRFVKNNLRSYDAFVQHNHTHTRYLDDHTQAPLVANSDSYIHVNRAGFSLTQNLVHGFFIRAVLGMQSNHYQSKQHDGTCHYYRINSPTGSGLYAGWTMNNDDTTYLDYFDCSFTTGIILPTSDFSMLPTTQITFIKQPSYYIFPLCLDGALSLYDWLVISMHEHLYLGTKPTALPDHEALYPHIAYTDTPTASLLNRIALSIKADHVALGFSLGLSYIQECGKTRINRPEQNQNNTGLCCIKTIGHSTWSTSQLIWIFCYDCTDENQTYGPRFEAWLNMPIGGHNSLKNQSCGVACGFDFA
jgi:hypothetical protein